MGIKKYITNLLAAFIGRNQCKQQLAQLTNNYNKVCENYAAYQNMYFNLLQKWDETEKQLTSSLILIENLRQRIYEMKNMQIKANSSMAEKTGKK